MQANRSAKRGDCLVQRWHYLGILIVITVCSSVEAKWLKILCTSTVALALLAAAVKGPITEAISIRLLVRERIEIICIKGCGDMITIWTMFLY